MALNNQQGFTYRKTNKPTDYVSKPKLRNVKSAQYLDGWPLWNCKYSKQPLACMQNKA